MTTVYAVFQWDDYCKKNDLVTIVSDANLAATLAALIFNGNYQPFTLDYGATEIAAGRRPFMVSRQCFQDESEAEDLLRHPACLTWEWTTAEHMLIYHQAKEYPHEGGAAQMIYAASAEEAIRLFDEEHARRNPDYDQGTRKKQD